MEFLILDFSRFLLPTLDSCKSLKRATNVLSYRHTAPIFTALLSLPSTFCLFDNKKKKKERESQNASGKGLNCTSLSLRRDRCHRRMSLGLLPLFRKPGGSGL